MEGNIPAHLQHRCNQLLDLALGNTAPTDGSGAEHKLGLDCLMDSFVALFDECQQSSLARTKNIAAFLKKYQEAVKKTKELQVKPSDFEVKATVGRGHFGEVQVVHEKNTNTVYAMKVLRKSDLLSQPDISFFEEERDIMASCHSPWLTKLHFAFQDSVNLYLVMDFHPGGDLLSLLYRHGDQFDEEMAKFYLAEMAIAINDLHQMGYLHRDIKPENVLLDTTGHIKLADFGSAAKMNSKQQVSSRMPVGTPDYVAPELLDSMNRANHNQSYGTEVDWWSLGICAYEMLFGSTPFTDDECSMVTTYANIMNFKNKLKFPSSSSVSKEAKDLIIQLLSDSKSRLRWPDLQCHPFFKGVNWSKMRDMEPPYIPTISSLDDTSNFDEVQKQKPPPNLESFQPSPKDFSGRHLPFVGFTFFRSADVKGRSPKKSLSNTTVLSELDSSVGLNTACFISNVESSTSINSPANSRMPKSCHSSTSDMEVTVTVKTCEMKELKDRCSQLEGKVAVLEAEKAALEKQLKEYIVQNQTLQHDIDKDKERSETSDKESVNAWKDLQAMTSQISSLEDQMLSFQLDELREIIVQLELEQEGLTRRLLQKDRQLESLQKSLTTAQQQLASKQHKLDRERRKSREGQKHNLALIESQEESWLKQLEEKQATIDDLNKKVRDLEDLVTAYEELEDEQEGELQQLHYKLNTSLLSTGVDTSDLNLDHSTIAHMEVSPPTDTKTKRVSLQVTLKSGRHSIRDNKTVEKLKELQTVVERYSKEAKSWRQKEENLLKKISKLEGDLMNQSHKEGVNKKTKQSLVTKVHVYQQEVHMQRKLIKELQKKMRSYLDDQTSITQTEAKLKDMQCQNLDLEAELFTVRQEAEQTRQTAMDKTREMEEIINKLEVARKQVMEYQEKYSKEVENADLKIRELEEQVVALKEGRNGLTEQIKSLLDQTENLQGLVDEGRTQVDRLSERNTLLNRQLQELTQRNADLMRQVESLQKVNKEEEHKATSRAELNTQLNRLQQHNDELQRQLQAAHREHQDLEDKTLTLQRDAERLNRRMARLEKAEAEKYELEAKLEKMSSLEREKKHLELRLSRLDNLEQEKAHLELKIERLEMDAKTTQMELKEAQEEKRHATDKYHQLIQERDAPNRDKAQQSPACKKLMADLLRSEKEELERQVKELKHMNVSAKDLRNDLDIKEAEVTDMKAKISSLEDQLEKKKKQIDDLEAKVKLLEAQVEAKEAKADEVKGLKGKVKALEDQVQDKERKVTEIGDLKAKVGSLEKQLKDTEKRAKVSGPGGSDHEKLAMSSELRDLIAQLQVKSSCVERLEREKAELEKRASEKKPIGLDRTPSLETRSCLVERLQTEKAELQRQLTSMEKERDMLRRASSGPDHRNSGSRNSLMMLQQSGSRIRAELEDKVQRLERVVKELERKLDISSVNSVDKATLQHEIEQLRIQIKETAEAEAQVHNTIPQAQYDGLKDSHEQLQDKFKDLQIQVEQLQKEKEQWETSSQKVKGLQCKVEQLQDEKAMWDKSSLKRTGSESKQRLLEVRVKKLEEENSELMEKLEKLQKQFKKLESEKKSLKEEIDKLKAGKSSASSSSRLVGQLTQEKHALESKVKSLEQQLESLQKRQQSKEHKTEVSAEVLLEKTELEAQVRKLTGDIAILKEEKARCQQKQSEVESRKEALELQVKDLIGDASKLREEVASLQEATRKQEAAQAQKEVSDDWTSKAEMSKNNAYLTTKVQELEKHLERANTRPNAGGVIVSRDVLVVELRKELHESNLAVSEARSLLAAGQRHEKELRERINKLQRVLDNGAISRANNIQMAAGAEQELRVLRSQYETLQRQYKNLEDRQNGSHKDKAATVLEVTLLKDQLQTKQQQLDMEIKKSQKLSKLCIELEDQMKDLEVIVDESEKNEAEWDKIRQTYERAVTEREEELEGATQKLKAVSSSRTAVDSRVAQLDKDLQTVKAQHKTEVDKLRRQVEEERAKAQMVAAKISSFEEKEHQYKQVLEFQGQNIKAENEVINELKEELSAKITEINDLKTINLKLNKHLNQAMDKFELIFGEKVSLENFNEALQGLHFMEKYKFESTIGQQMKLIDYLQDLYMENSGKKKKGHKRGGSARGKEGHPIPGLPLQWTDLQTALDQEQKKTAKLQEQLDKLREENFTQASELLKLKQKVPLKERVDNSSSSKKSSKTLTPRGQTAAMATLLRSPSAQTTTPCRAGGRRYQVPVQPTPQRMHHNIPHRFVTGLNTRATKCGLCLGSVHFVKQASKCQECGMVVHPKCASSVPATCGLPTEYVRHFADMMSRIEEAEMQSSSEPLNIKMEGWLKVPRTGKPGWEKRWVELDGSYLMLYREDTDANPVDTFDLSPPDAEVSVHSAVTAAELTSTASLDLHYVLRLDQDPLTTCWPGRYLYLMTTNFSEKQRWTAALEAAVRSMQRQDNLRKNNWTKRIHEPHMTTVISLKEGDRKEFNCVLALSPQLILLGTDDGLFALNPQTTSGRQHLVQLSGFGSVHQMAEAKGINIVLLLTGPERRLVMVESKLIKCRMSQTIGGETTPFTYKPVEGIQSCTVFEVDVWADASYLCVGMPDKVVLLKYNPSLTMYCVRKEMPCSQPCSCMCMVEGLAIVGTERFYRISLEHPSLIDFLDRQDSTLAFAAFGAANHHSFPLAVVQVSPEGLPLEFLLCFHEFGVFVDHRGQRSRQSDIKWSGLPLSFLYAEPFLYITYFNSLQATVVPSDKDQVKGCQTAVDLPAPRNLGRAEEAGAIYVASSSNGITEVTFLRAHDQRRELTDSDDEKENNTRQVRWAPSPEKSHGAGFTIKTSISLMSLDSVSSTSTFTSVESTL